MFRGAGSMRTYSTDRYLRQPYAVVRNQAPDVLGLAIVPRAGRDRAQHELLGGASAEQNRHPVVALLPRQNVPALNRAAARRSL